MEWNLVNALVTIAFGAVAGGVTNAVAIWMLFHPYDAKGVGRLRLQGAIPKNKMRLAKTIGRTVGERLLTSEDLTKQLMAPGLREAFDSAVSSFVTSLLQVPNAGPSVKSCQKASSLKSYRHSPPFRLPSPIAWPSTPKRTGSVKRSRTSSGG